MSDHTFARRFIGNAPPQDDRYGQQTVTDTTPTTLLTFTMPEDSYSILDILMIARGANGTDLASAWKTVRYTRIGAAAPASGVSLDIQTVDTAAGALTFTTDASGRINAVFTADASAIGRSNITAAAQARFIVVD